MKIQVLLTVFLAGLLAAGCSKSKDNSHKSTEGGHVHVAPNGGTLVEIGEHTYNLELVRDNVAGKLTAYVLDGHAENFVRIKSPVIELIAMPGGTYTPMSLKAVANPSTGETVGDTCQFEAQADWLKTAGDFSASSRWKFAARNSSRWPITCRNKSLPALRPAKTGLRFNFT